MRDREEHHVRSHSPTGANWHVASWLTVPQRAPRSELQILIHGASYDHRYWDWPLEADKYSYVSWARQHGYATLAIDRIGCGASTRPPGREATVTAQAQALHDVVTAARDGVFGSFERVVLVGHSLGSTLSVAEASEYRDVDAVVLTGSLGADARTLNNDPRAAQFFGPALDDPALRHFTGVIDDGYVTPFGQARVPMFYAESSSDPKIVEFDETIKGTMTLGEMSDLGTAAERAGEIDVPVLVLVGEHDALMFDHETETDTYQSTRRSAAMSPDHFDFVVLPDVGHNLNLHHRAHDAYAAIGSWLDALAVEPQIASGAQR